MRTILTKDLALQTAVKHKGKIFHREEEGEEVSFKPTAEAPVGRALVRDEIVHRANKHADL